MNEEFEKKSISGFALKHGMYSLETVLNDGEQLIEDRLNLNAVIENNNYCPDLHILYNVFAKDDIDNQIIPFIKNLSPEYHLGNKVNSA